MSVYIGSIAGISGIHPSYKKIDKDVWKLKRGALSNAIANVYIIKDNKAKSYRKAKLVVEYDDGDVYTNYAKSPKELVFEGMQKSKQK